MSIFCKNWILEFQCVIEISLKVDTLGNIEGNINASVIDILNRKQL